MNRSISIIGGLDWDTFSAFSDAINELENKSKTKDINLHLASEGGTSGVALAIVGRMRVSPCNINVFAFGDVSSAATLILASGSKRFMAAETWVMVHEDSGKIRGSVADWERDAKHARSLEAQWNNIMASHTLYTAETWEKLNKATTYLTASECLECGLIDEII